jgi:hypothetical protein
MSNLSHEEEAEAKKIVTQFRIAGGFVLFVLSLGMVFYHFVEKMSWVDAFYFCIVTLSTVGYGDITPDTTAGKIFTSFYIIVGIGLLATFANLAIKRGVVAHKRRH